MNEQERFISIIQKIEVLEKERIYLRDYIVEQMDKLGKDVIQTLHGNLALRKYKLWVYPKQIEDKYKEEKRKAQDKGTASYTYGTSYLHYEPNDLIEEINTIHY